MNCWQAVAGWCRGRVVLLIRSRQGGCGFRLPRLWVRIPLLRACRRYAFELTVDAGSFRALRGPKNATTRVVSTRVDVYCDVKCGLRGAKIKCPTSQ